MRAVPPAEPEAALEASLAGACAIVAEQVPAPCSEAVLAMRVFPINNSVTFLYGSFE